MQLMRGGMHGRSRGRVIGGQGVVQEVVVWEDGGGMIMVGRGARDLDLDRILFLPRGMRVRGLGGRVGGRGRAVVLEIMKEYVYP